ncbi:MAG: hypothetical protein ACHQPI_02450 [Thermoanaerobaculia bacterium]
MRSTPIPTPTLIAILLLAPAAAIRGQGPSPAATPRPVLCPGLSGFEIGQQRRVVYESIARSGPPAGALGPDLSLLFVPRDRRYKVNVTFDAGAPEARITALHYVFDPAPGLLPGLRDRYGPETPAGGDPATHVWDVPSCGVRIRYRVQLSGGNNPLVEELWIDRLPAKGTKTPVR